MNPQTQNWIVRKPVARGAGEPKVEGSGSNATWRWSNGESAITGYGGANQVFVVFNLASYPAAVERKKHADV